MCINVRRGDGPPVVFISQLGTGGDSWQPIVDLLPDAFTVTYDRPGTGDAPPRAGVTWPLAHGAFAAELAELLEREAVTEQIVLVGHSFGGSIARVYAGTFPQRVAGLVFIDSSIPQSFLTPGDQAWRDGDGPGATEIDTVTGQVDILSARIPQVPAAVMARAHGRWDGANQPPHPAVEDLWRVSQRVLAKQYQAPLIITRNTGHQIPGEAPRLTAHVIGTVVKAARVGGPVVFDETRLGALGGDIED